MFQPRKSLNSNVMKVLISTASLLIFTFYSAQGKSQGEDFFCPMAGHCIAPLEEGKTELQLTEWPDSEYDILAIGGRVGDSVVSSCDHYDAENDLWNPISSLPNARVEFTTHTFAGKVYVIGGWDGDSTVYNDILEFDPSVGEWDVVTSLLGPRKGHASVHEGPMESGSILVCGGNNGTAGLATCELVNLLNYEVLPADTMVEPRERFQLFRMEKYSSEQFTMNIGETWKDGYDWIFPPPNIYSDYNFPVPDNYQGIMVSGGYNYELNSPTSSCELYLGGNWIPVQDLPIPLSEYSYGMNSNPYVFEPYVSGEAYFEEERTFPKCSPYLYGGVTSYSESGEEVLSNNFMAYNMESSEWESISLDPTWADLADKNQVLLHAPRIAFGSWEDDHNSLIYIIGGDPEDAPFADNGLSIQIYHDETPVYYDIDWSFGWGEPDESIPELCLNNPGFIQRGERGYVVGTGTEATSVWFDLSPVNMNLSSVRERSLNLLKAFPNPAQDMITLNGVSHQLKWELYNSGGQQVLSGHGQEIRVNNLSPGLYHLHTEDGRKAIVMVE